MPLRRRDRFVSGIYNYCDRWCEKCAFTFCCRVCQEERLASRRRKPADGDEMEWSMKAMSRSFEKVGRLLSRWAKREGLDLEQMAKEGAELEAKRPKPENANVAKLAENYMDSCDGVLKKLRDLIEQTGKDMAERAGYMDVKADVRRLRKVVKASKVLMWDFRLIYVKIKRSLDSVVDLNQTTDAEMRRFEQYDIDGSAAVARRSLVRSQAALTTVYEWDEAMKDDALDLLVKAQRVLRSLDHKFPGAAGFKWPPPEAVAQAREIEKVVGHRS